MGDYVEALLHSTMYSTEKGDGGLIKSRTLHLSEDGLRLAYCMQPLTPIHNALRFHCSLNPVNYWNVEQCDSFQGWMHSLCTVVVPRVRGILIYGGSDRPAMKQILDAADPSRITRLFFCACAFSGYTIEAIGRLLAVESSSVTHLVLVGCTFTGHSEKTMRRILENSKLTCIVLHMTQLEDPKEFLSRLPRSTNRLELCYVEPSDRFRKAVLAYLESSKQQLQHLNLSNNTFGGEEFRAITNVVSHSKTIETFIVLGMEGIWCPTFYRSIVELVQMNQRLRDIRFGIRQDFIGPQTIDSVPILEDLYTQVRNHSRLLNCDPSHVDFSLTIPGNSSFEISEKLHMLNQTMSSPWFSIALLMLSVRFDKSKPKVSCIPSHLMRLVLVDCLLAKITN